jgi:hypothetical protein
LSSLELDGKAYSLYTVSMNAMNRKIRAEVKRLIHLTGKTQKEISSEMGLKNPQYLSEMLNTEKSGVPERWQDLIDVLNQNLKGKQVNSDLLELFRSEQ